MSIGRHRNRWIGRPVTQLDIILAPPTISSILTLLFRMFVRSHRGSKILAAREPGSRIFLREPTSSVEDGSVECFSFDPWGGPATEYTAIRTARWPPRVLISAGWIDAQEHIRLRMSKILGEKEGNKGSSIIQPVDSTRGCD